MDSMGGTFELVLCRAKGRGPGLEVRLARNGVVVDAIPLAWGASAREAHAEPLDATVGAGDPAASREGTRAWVVGDAEGRVVTVIRPVRLGETGGLLVHQQGGFEHLKQRHALFVADGPNLKRVWEREEGVGPRWSWADVTPDGYLVYVEGFISQEPADPDKVDVRRFAWDDRSRECVETAGPGQWYAVAFGWYPTKPEAEAARDQAVLKGQTRAAWILPSERLDKSRPGAFALASVSASKDIAGKAADSARAAGYLGALLDLNP